MGKAKPLKKPSTPVKISTSLFQQKKSKHSSTSDSESSSSPPSPKPTKKKVKKSPPPKSKAKPKSGKPTAKIVPKKEKGESKKKVIGTKGKDKAVATKGSKDNQPTKSKAKEKVITKKKKEAPPKRKPPRRRSSSSHSDSSSSSSSDDETSSSSRTRSPSPPRKVAAGKKNVSPASKSKSPAKKVPLSKKDKNDKKGKVTKEKKVVAKKGVAVKGKAKPTKPKAKAKRMASLNAKAILEASFSFESGDKKKSPAGTPLKSTSPKGGGGTNSENLDNNESVDFKPLTLLFSSATETDFPKEGLLSSPKNSGERKRKSSSITPNTRGDSPTRPQINNTTTNTSNGTSPKRETSSSSTPLHAKAENVKEKSKSPGPKKKAKVASSSVSTSTSPFDPNEDHVPSHHYESHSRGSGKVDMGLQRHFTHTSAFHHQSLHSPEEPTPPNHFSQHHKIRGNHGKEKANSVTPTPVTPYGSTVYQPAGPLIEPHKTVPSGLLPESVRIPSDLKVTYQTRPPSSTVTSTGNQSSKGSEGSGGKRSEGRHGSKSTSQKSTHDKQILHQPYKSATTAPPTTATSSSMTVTTSQGPNLMMSSGGGPSQSTALPSHLHPSSTIMASGASSSPGSLYFGFGGAPHQSPFAPSKYPMVPPDSYRAQSPFPSPYLYAPTTPQPPQNYFMTPPFYNTQSLGQPPGTGGLTVGTPQPRQLFAAHHHPSTVGTNITGAPFYQPPPSAHPVSNYYLTAPPAQPSHHSMQPSSAPGHAGPSHPNPSSPPACPCPTESSLRSNNSKSNNNNSTSITANNNKTNRSLLRKQPLQQPVISDTTPQAVSALAVAKPALSKQKINRTRNIKDSSQIQLPSSLSPKINPKKPVTLDLSRAKQLENAKTFTEQYSLPEDITITPIIMNAIETKALPFTSVGALLPATKPEKKKDIVHVIDTRSGESTTIAKHISINNIHKNTLVTRNVSSVKPNNAGNVGKISPSLDVIVLSPEKKQLLSKVAGYETKQQQVNRSSGEQINQQRSPQFLGKLSDRPPLKGQHPSGKSILFTNSNTNLVQPLLQVGGTKNENKAKIIKRKGLTLNECIDGLQRKKMRILADTNVSITNVTPTPPPPPSNNNIINLPIYNHHQLTILPATDNHIRNQQLNSLNFGSQEFGQKMGRKDTKSKPRRISSLPVEPLRRQGTIPKRTTSTESEFGTKLIDCNAAVAAVSALRIPSPIPLNSSPYYLHNAAIKKRQQQQQKKPTLKIKLYKSEEGKITTRSTTQGSKVRTRGTAKLKQSEIKLKGMGKFPVRGRSRLLLQRDKDGSKSDSSGSQTPFYPYYQQTQGNGSSTLTTSNNHVILRIPKSSSGEKSKGDQIQSRIVSPTSTGNMTVNAMKKRAIVKPLSPSLVNGALHTLAMSNKKLPIHTHPRWSNGWRFEGKAFEAKVYIKNDDNPVLRRCYPTMKHDGGDVIRARDCVLLKSGPRKTDLPFVAKVAALFENPADGEMMFSLLWYYRPEHTDIGRNKEDMPDEIFASKHRDSNSVATIEDKCYVFTFNEYCRYKKRLKQLLEGVTENIPIVPLFKNRADTGVPVTNLATDVANAVWSGISSTISSLTSASASEDPSQQQQQPPPPPPPPTEPPRPAQPTSGKISPEVVFFCRKVYDYRQKRMLKNPS